MNWLNRIRRILPSRELFSSGIFWVPATTFVAIALGAVCLSFWGQMNSIVEIRTEQLETGTKTIRTETVESFSTTIRNVGLVVGGIVAVMLAVWRSLVAQRQADATLRQASAALLQSQTTERESRTTLLSFLNERYEQGSSRLGSNDPAVRLDGIDVLERLAREHPSEYHVQVIKRLSLFVRNSADANRLREEVHAAMEVIGSRNEEDIALETDESFELNLGGSDLQGLGLARLNLSGSNLTRANFSGAVLYGVDFSNASFRRANLKDARLFDANLSGAQFSIGEGEHSARGVTQAQLNEAIAHKDTPPYLDGVLDAESGEQLKPPFKEPGWLEKLREELEALKQRQSRTE